jgi:putative hydrolase of the HAD superfamily
MTRQHLIIDADDTLWENNIYFEAAFDDFVEFLAHSSLTSAQVRETLDEIEVVNREIHGYGAINFGHNLRECYQRLCERKIGQPDLDRVMTFAERILEQPVEVIDGVEDTLAQLAGRHNLMLFTKGHPEEQKLKIERSGLARHFRHTAIVKEKNAAAYGELAAKQGLEAARTWMIGNSPRSDINPALEAGLGAVYIPHARTWTLEHEQVREDAGRLLILNSFRELLECF